MSFFTIKLRVGLAVAIILALLTSGVVQAQAPVSSAQVVTAIKRGVNYLLSHRNPKTFWEENLIIPGKPEATPQFLGESAIVIESLLDVEQSLKLQRLYPFNSPMKECIHFLISHRNPTTYAVSFQANALALLPRRAVYNPTLRWDANILLHSIHSDGGYHYAWGTANYFPNYLKFFPNTPGDWDNSNTQYGVLGAWAVEHAGIRLPAAYWRLAAEHWRRKQFANGCWGYWGFVGVPSLTAKFPFNHWATFTPAGVASLLICDEFLGAQHVGIHPIVDRNILAGLAWINHNFNPGSTDPYQMYCYERVGLASGLQTFAGHNWYDDYCRTLIAQQSKKDGGWPIGGLPEFVDTAYALLILDRGLNPVFMNKLQYSPNFYGQWNARQRDVANMVSWVSTTTETPLNWQVVDFNSPVSNWLNSPILMITGHKDPHFSPQDIAELRAYVDAGGMVFCSCDGSSFSFRRAMMKYGREVVNNQYEFHRLTTKSMLLTLQPWYHMYFNMLAISNGVRDVWVVSPEDMGSVWERRAFAEKKYWEFPLNLYLYATGKGYLADRLHSLVVPPVSGAPARTLAVGRLQYHGNWNPEPGAWPRLALLVRSRAQTQINVSTITTASLNPHNLPLLDMTGTGRFTFTAAQVAALRKYLNTGGMLFADAAGGQQEFTDAFTALTMKLYPKAVLRRLPVKCTMYTGSMPGGVLATRVDYRRFYIDENGIKHTPEFLGIKRAGRWVIVFSPDDVTSGFLGTNTWGISGYTPKSAVALATNVIEYAVQHAH
ncbi:MAG: DUF4159 domain-containing protein [Planctomycetia bacterium]|nr:DUF4159 domain-containing protein [Planctomycetia bacterium]